MFEGCKVELDLTIRGHALFAACAAGLLVLTPLDWRATVIVAWMAALLIALIAQARRREYGRALMALPIQLAVGAAILYLASIAPVKHRDRLMAMPVKLPHDEMSLSELQRFAEGEGRRAFPLPIWISCPQPFADARVRWPSTKLTVREFVGGIEIQSPLRHQVHSCGTGSTLLFGGSPLGLSLSRETH